jgi:2-dehydro-3-deoxy-D-arabinonate dehydratase
MKLFKTKSGAVILNKGKHYLLKGNWDGIINRDQLYHYLSEEIKSLPAQDDLSSLIENELLAPIGNQEVWAAGVTYFRSREARMEESKTSGGATFYDDVYEAKRPELFFKAIAQRVVGHGDVVNIRRDSTWSVPEPELTLFINTQGRIEGYTCGNDMSSRSIEGENPLYLPQAKSYDRSAALGPCLHLTQNPISPETTISMEIIRGGKVLYKDSVEINKMKRTHTELADYLFRECEFPFGCFLMTGTCLVPPNDFTLQVNDTVRIEIGGIGALTNTVGIRS